MLLEEYICISLNISTNIYCIALFICNYLLSTKNNVWPIRFATQQQQVYVYSIYIYMYQKKSPYKASIYVKRETTEEVTPTKFPSLSETWIHLTKYSSHRCAELR